MWSRLVDGFWLVPGATALGYAVLAIVAVRLDRAAGSRGFGFGFGGDADAARDILTTIAGSLITVAGLAFSLTIVVLTLVSAQFSPRAVRSLLADKLNQVIAGSFVGIFAYCLLVLRTIRDESSSTDRFVPALGVTLGIALGLLSLALLLTFIHHAATSIQVSSIAARIGRATLAGVERLYPERYGDAVEERPEEMVGTWRAREEPAVVHARRTGFVQALVLDDLVEAFEERGTRLHVRVRPGDFVSEATALLEIWPAAAVTEDRASALRAAVVIAEARDLRQDAAYGLRQLADIALKALSPGLNDPTTAENCIAYLGGALEKLAGRTISGAVRRYPDEDAIVVARRRGFEEHLDDAFAEIGRYASANARVVLDVLGALSRVHDAALRAGAWHRIAVIEDVARAAAEPALEQAATERDRSAIRAALESLAPRPAPDSAVAAADSD